MSGRDRSEEERGREGERERERGREGERDFVCGLGGQEIKSWIYPTRGFFLWVFFSGRTFTQGLKITGEKHAGNLLSW